ncbi:MAG: cytochrome c oxidase subunit 3 [Planctomycetota bacterium]
MIRKSDEFRVQQPGGGLRSRTGAHVPGVGTLGMKIFIASLSFIFAATILLYVLIVANDETPDVHVLPVVSIGMAVSTIVILASSFTLRRATRAIRHDDREGLFTWLRRTLGLGYAFGVSQTVNWVVMVLSGISFDPSERHSGMFVVVTVVHALHVVGGVVRLVQITGRARRKEFSASEHEPVTNLALYWHFLDVVWVLLVIAIVAVTV